MKTKINEKLLEEVEGTCMGDYGFLVCVTQVDDIGSGKIRDGIAEVSFPVQYRAIVFRPFKNEVLDGVVTMVDQMGCFIEIGPLTVFCSRLQIPTDYQLNTEAQPHWAYEHVDDPNNRITVGSEIRVKLMGVQVELSEMNAVGTINENFLGPLD